MPKKKKKGKKKRTSSPYEPVSHSLALLGTQNIFLLRFGSLGFLQFQKCKIKRETLTLKVQFFFYKYITI